MKSKQLSYAPAEVNCHYCGYATPLILQFGDLIKKQIALLCYKEPKSVSDLCEELQTGYEYIQDAVNELCNTKVLIKEQGKYQTLLPMIHLSVNNDASYIKYKYIWENEIPKRIIELINGVKDELCSMDFYGNTFDIKYLNWVLFVMIYNMIQRKLRLYFSEKTDEVIIDNYSWRTNNFENSAFLTYKYADEHPEKDVPECDKTLKKWSTFYNYIGDIGVYNVFDSEPFSMKRNEYFNSDNLFVYLDLVNGKPVEMNDKNKKIIDDFLEVGVVVKEGDRVKPMIPVIPKDVVEKGEQIMFKALSPLIKEMAESLGDKIEEIILPSLGEVKTRKDHFYSFWKADFVNPRQELFWYGMNVEGLEIPKDYKKSVAGMWITY